MEDDKKNPYVPAFITAKSMALMENCTVAQGKGRFKRMRSWLGLKRGEKVTAEDYCRYRGTTLQRIARFFERPFVIILLLTSCITFAFAQIVRRNCFPALNDWLKKHHVIWDYTSHSHQHGTMWIKNEAGKMEKITIDVERQARAEWPAFLRHYYDSVDQLQHTPLNVKR